MPDPIHEYFINQKQDELDVYVCGKDVNLKPGIRYGPVIRDLYIIECCTSGLGSVIINGHEFLITPKTCIILKPGDIIIHTADKLNPRCGVWCGINGLNVEYYINRLKINSKQPFAPAQAFDQVTESIEKLLKLNRCDDPGVKLRRSAIAHMIFGQLLQYVPRTTEPAKYIEKAINIMQTRYEHDINITEIAKILGLERCYFSTLFKKHTGISAYKYLTELRLQKACTLLANPAFSIQEIALSIGIHPQNFARVFEKHIKATPGQYRKNLTPDQ